MFDLWIGIRGWAEQKQRISIPVPALPVQEFWQGKSRKICNSLNWFKGVTFTFWIKMHRKNIFPKINSKIYKFSVFFPARIPVPAMPEPESNFFVSVPLTPYEICFVLEFVWKNYPIAVKISWKIRHWELRWDGVDWEYWRFHRFQNFYHTCLCVYKHKC